MSRVKGFLIVFCGLLVIWAEGAVEVSSAWQSSARIVGLRAYPKHSNLVISFRVENWFTPGVREAIKSGVPTSFHVYIVVQQPGFSLFRKPVAKVTLEHGIVYKQLEDRYLLRFTEYPDKVIVVKDCLKARQLVSEVKALPLIPLWRLQPDREYEVKVKAELSRIPLPRFLRYLLFFMPLWEFKTDWEKIPFRY